MAEQHRAKKTKKNRKHGRNAHFCLQYKNRNVENRNKVIRLKKHLKRFPDDVVAKAAMEVAKATS